MEVGGIGLVEGRLGGALGKAWAIFDRAVDGLAILAGAILVFINLAVCYGVAMRYFLARPPIWVLQTTEYALLWIVFLAATWLLREKGHVSVDILYSRLGPGTRRRLDAATYSAAGVACAGVLVLSALYLVDCVRNDVADVRAVTVPKWTVFAVIPLGSLFLTLQLFRSAWERARPAPGERADR